MKVALAVIANTVGVAVIVVEEGTFIVCAMVAPTVVEETVGVELIVYMEDPDTVGDAVGYVVVGADTLSAVMPSLVSVLEGAGWVGGQLYTV